MKYISYIQQGIKKTLWVMPFIFFISGYFGMNFFIPTHQVTTPTLIFKTIPEALELTSQESLGLIIASTKEDTLIKEPIIVQQTPLPGTKIKKNKTMYIVVAQPPSIDTMPSCIGLRLTECQKTLHSLHTNSVYVDFFSELEPDQCIAQWPEAHKNLEEHSYCYIASKKDVYLLPSLIGYQLFEVEDFLKKHGIHYKIHATIVEKKYPKLLATAKIIEQQPNANALISLKNPPTLYLHVEQ